MGLYLIARKADWIVPPPKCRFVVSVISRLSKPLCRICFRPPLLVTHRQKKIDWALVGEVITYTIIRVRHVGGKERHVAGAVLAHPTRSVPFVLRGSSRPTTDCEQTRDLDAPWNSAGVEPRPLPILDPNQNAL